MQLQPRDASSPLRVKRAGTDSPQSLRRQCGPPDTSVSAGEPDFSPLTSRMVRGSICIAFNPQGCGNWLQQPQDTNSRCHSRPEELEGGKLPGLPRGELQESGMWLLSPDTVLAGRGGELTASSHLPLPDGASHGPTQLAGGER